MICNDCKEYIDSKYVILEENGLYHLYHLYITDGCISGKRKKLCMKCGIDKFKNFLTLDVLVSSKLCRPCIDNLKGLENDIRI